MTNPRKYFRNNVGSGLNLLDAAIEAKVRKFVFSSTCATYGPPDRIPMTEDLPQRPINPYGESKLAFEKILRWYGEIHGLSPWRLVDYWTWTREPDMEDFVVR